MRSFVFMIAVISVIGLAYWAYNENYATQDALRQVDRLQREIGEASDQLNVLRAEWAYLNRPDRLRELVDLNYPSLHLIPLTPEHFGSVDQVAYPPLQLEEVKNPVDLIAEFDGQVAEVPE